MKMENSLIKCLLIVCVIALVNCSNNTDVSVTKNVTLHNPNEGVLVFSLICEGGKVGSVSFASTNSNSFFDSNFPKIFFDCSSALFDEKPYLQLLFLKLKPGKYHVNNFTLGSAQLKPSKNVKYFEFQVLPQKITYVGRIVLTRGYHDTVLVKNIYKLNEDLPKMDKKFHSINLDKEIFIQKFM